MNEFKKQKTGILRIDDSTVLLMGDIYVSGEDADWQFEENHREDCYEKQEKEKIEVDEDFDWRGVVND